jgi:hypothetical protein
MKNGVIPICDRIESKMSDLILSINQTHSIFDADKLPQNFIKDQLSLLSDR